MCLRRREVLLGGALSAFYPSCLFAEMGGQIGCVIDDNQLRDRVGSQPSSFEYNIDKDPVINGSGNKLFDKALAHTLANISSQFSVLPGFAFFDDSDGPNAFASQSKRLGRDAGSVVFGRELFKIIMKGSDHPEVGVVAVCAHEFGHIAQYKLGVDKQLVGPDRRVKRLELHADFLAGFFAGIRKIQSEDFPAASIAMTQYQFGDIEYNNPNHHGTKKERGGAVVAGFDAAYKERKKFSSAVAAGVQYVMQIPL